MARLLKAYESIREDLDLGRELSQSRLLCTSLASLPMVQRPIDLLPGTLAAILLGAACHQIGSATGQRVKQGVVGSAACPAQCGLVGMSSAVANHADSLWVIRSRSEGAKESTPCASANPIC